MPLGRLVFIATKKPISPGQVEAIIDVCFLDDHQVLDPIHFRREAQQAKYRLIPCGMRKLL